MHSILDDPKGRHISNSPRICYQVEEGPRRLTGLSLHPQDEAVTAQQEGKQGKGPHMNRGILSLISLAILVLVPAIAPAVDDKYVNSIDQFLHRQFDARDDCMVIGLIDGSGSRVLAAGKLDNGTDRVRAPASRLR